MDKLKLLLTFLLLDVAPERKDLLRYIKYFVALVVWLSLSVVCFPQEGEYPFTPVDITAWVNGGHAYQDHNVGHPYSVLYGMSGSWTLPTQGLQGNDKMTWMRYVAPTTGWYEIRTDCEMGMPNGWGGCQTLLFEGNPLDPFQSDFAGIWATGAIDVPYPGQSASLFVELEANHAYLIAVDGWGPSVGKFELRVRRSIDSDGTLVQHFWPVIGPPNYTTIVQ